MRKAFLMTMIAVLLLSSCSSYTATGAYVGGEFGHVIGSAIGGITGGRRGHDMGSLIGTVGGVAAGAAIGAMIDGAQNSKYNDRVQQEQLPRNDRRYDDRNYGTGNNSGYHFDRGNYEDNTCYDDRITFDGEGPGNDVPSYSVAELSRKPAIEIRNAGIYDSDHNGFLTRGEKCTVVFEIMNNTPSVVYDIYPIVEDVTGNRHVNVSPNLRVESIAPFSGIRYTATILADRKLKDGEIMVRVGVAQGNSMVESQTKQFSVPTRKKVSDK